VGKRVSRPAEPGPLIILFHLSLVAAGGLSLVALVAGENFGIPDSRSWAALLAYGVVSQVIGWLLISQAMPRVATSWIGLILLLQPTLTFIWDIVLFHRPTSSLELAGAVLALAAIYLGNVRR
jgi:drug/metabolite transporter (DMT)-like permease